MGVKIVFISPRSLSGKENTIETRLNQRVLPRRLPLCCAVGYNIKWLMRAIARLGLRGLLLGLDLLMQLRELERNISKQIKFQFENRNLNTQVLLKFIKMNFAGSTF